MSNAYDKRTNVLYFDQDALHRGDRARALWSEDRSVRVEECSAGAISMIPNAHFVVINWGTNAEQLDDCSAEVGEVLNYSLAAGNVKGVMIRKLHRSQNLEKKLGELMSSAPKDKLIVKKAKDSDDPSLEKDFAEFEKSVLRSSPSPERR